MVPAGEASRTAGERTNRCTITKGLFVRLAHAEVVVPATLQSCAGEPQTVGALYMQAFTYTAHEGSGPRSTPSEAQSAVKESLLLRGSTKQVRGRLLSTLRPMYCQQAALRKKPVLSSLAIMTSDRQKYDLKHRGKFSSTPLPFSWVW